MNNQLRTSSNPRTQAIIQNGQVMVQKVQGRQSQGYAGIDGNIQASGERVINPVGNTGANQPRDKMLLAQAQEAGLADHVDAYDLDYDDEATTNAILMANLSLVGSLNDDTVAPHYDSDTLSESCDELKGNSDVISYTDYMITIRDDVDNYVPSPIQKNDMMLSVIEQMKSQVENYNKHEIFSLSSMNASREELRCLHEIGIWEQSNTKGALKADVIPFSENLKETFKLFEKGFIVEVKEMKDIFEQMEDEVDQCYVAKKSFEIKKKQLLINNDRLLEENIASDIMCIYLRSLIIVERTKLYSVTLIPNSKVIPKVVEKNDLSKSITSHLTSKKIIENCTKVLASATLQELLEQARALKPLDKYIGYASKFAMRIQELLVYVSASCPFTQSGNEKWAPATSHKRNNKPYVDASRTKQIIKTITKEHAVKQNTRKTDNTMFPSTGRVRSTNASGSKPRSNKKNDKIPQSSRRSMKNKVETNHRKFKSSANKNNHVSDCNANVKNVALSKNSNTICLTCNECLFSANHDACVVKYLKKMQKRLKLDTHWCSFGGYCADWDFVIEWRGGVVLRWFGLMI
ncbi:hypothetical protein Tco_0616029 [Tanacetum coccineum]